MAEITDATDRPALKMIGALPRQTHTRSRSPVSRPVGALVPTARARPTLLVPNVETTANYYVSVLGFALDAPSFDPAHCASVVRWGRTVLILKGTARGESLPLYCAVDDVQDVHRELQNNGAVIVLSPQFVDGNWSAFDIADCDGHRVRFIQFTTPRLHECATPKG